MKMPRLKFPKLCLSTILIEIGIICTLVAVNTRPMSYAMGSGYLDRAKAARVFDGGWVFVPPGSNSDADKYTEYVTFDNDRSTRVANYGWPLNSVEIMSETRKVHHVHKQRLATNIAICLTIVVGSAFAIEWSVRYAQRKQKSRAIVD